MEQPNNKDQSNSLLGAVQDYSRVVFGAESLYRSSLIELVDKIVHNRIGSIETRRDESAFMQSKVIMSMLGSKEMGNYDDIKSFESPEESRKKLTQAYREVLGTVYQMDTWQLLDFITRLRSDRLLIRVLHSLPKKRIAEAYRPLR